jgi:D-cysteine desulfhydrase
MSKVKGICCANGSGGTVAGLLLGSAISKISLKIFGVNVIGSKNEMHSIITELVEDCGRKYKINTKVNFDNLELLDGYSEEGYKHISPAKIELINNFAGSTGIILDPTYTGKAFYAYHENFITGKRHSNIIFLHTGGLFGIFAKADKFV